LAPKETAYACPASRPLPTPENSSSAPSTAPVASTGSNGFARSSHEPGARALEVTSSAATGTSRTLSLAETASAIASMASHGTSRAPAEPLVPAGARASADSRNVSASSSPMDVAASSAGKCSRDIANSPAASQAAGTDAPHRLASRMSKSAFSACSSRLMAW
jgi:hypothetical protein